MVKNTIEMNRQEWLLERTKGIGGSDASIILGLNKYKTPFELWLEKTDQSHLTDTAGEAAYFGNLLEDMVAKEFEIRSGKKVRRNNFMLQHTDYPFLMANIDRKVVGEDALLECKTASTFLTKEWDSEEIPEAYLVQVQHYLGVTGYSKAYIAVLIGGQKFVWKEIERDEELIQMIFDAEIHFWNYHVKGNRPPALDGSSAAEKFLKERFANVEQGKSIDLESNYKEKIDDLLSIKNQIKELQKVAKETENKIKHELKEAESGFVKNYQVDWKQFERKSVDSKLLKSKYPDVYNSVLKTSNYRKFNVKELG
ncbi:YqaJ viral recombinase family protein [Oceanobacillus kimchii]|uniref:YqaJ viral recombinase family nuclease n=1 Tax=Oceanobacillus kimchii TaxID=746691 RepID=UPI003C73C0C7